MKKLDVPQSGSAADVVASRNRFGQYNRTRATPIQPRTDRQNLIRGFMSDASGAWRDLTDAVRAAWNSYGSTTPSVDSLGQTVYPTGHQRFVGLYVALANVGLTVPPSVPTIPPEAPPAVTGLTILNDGTAELTVSPVASSTKVLVIEASPPVSAGVSFNGDYRFVTKLTVTTLGVAPFGTPLTAKFGLIPTGRRVFIRAYWVTAAGGKSQPTTQSAISEEP